MIGKTLLLVFLAPALVLAGENATNCASDDPSYAAMLSPIDGLNFYWTVSEDALSVKLVYTKDETWLSVGPSKDGQMVDAEVIVALPGDNTVKKYELTGKSNAGVEAMSQQTLTGTSVIASGGTTEVTFVKLLAESGELEIVTDGPTTLIFAVGSGTSLGYHVDDISLAIDLKSCDSSVVSVKSMSTTAVLMHAAIMIGAWMWLVPAGVLTAVAKARFGARWLKIHLPIQVGATLAMVCGALAIFMSLEDTGDDHLNEHETEFGNHARLGCLALLLALFQVAWGWFRPPKPGKDDPKPWIRWAFEWGHKIIGHFAVAVALLAILSGIEHATEYSYISGDVPLALLIGSVGPLVLCYATAFLEAAGVFKA